MAGACYDVPTPFPIFIMTDTTTSRALLLFAHGSSDPGWAAPFVQLQTTIRRRDPDQIVELAYLERMQPSFDEAVDAMSAAGILHITVAPLFLAMGGHMRKDLPALIHNAQKRTGIAFQLLPTIGEVDALIEAMADWVMDTRG